MLASAAAPTGGMNFARTITAPATARAAPAAPPQLSRQSVSMVSIPFETLRSPAETQVAAERCTRN